MSGKLMVCGTCGEFCDQRKCRCYLDRANEQLACSTDASLCSGAAGKAPADDPSVQGTDLRSGFVKLRARAMQAHSKASYYFDEYKGGGPAKEQEATLNLGQVLALRSVIAWIDELSGCEE
jgi:hypothetical protein